MRRRTLLLLAYATLAWAADSFRGGQLTHTKLDDDNGLLWESVEKEVTTPPEKPRAHIDCSGDFGMCIDSKCCTNPGFACFKRPDKAHAQCRPFDVSLRSKPIYERWQQCVDTDEWLCPNSWRDCSADYESCTDTLCCAHQHSACFRRSHLYHGQCRPAAHLREGRACVDTPDSEWLCPGWEKCAAPHEECTRPRCCERDSSNTKYVCALNKSDTTAWHAYCRHEDETKGVVDVGTDVKEDAGWWKAAERLKARARGFMRHVDKKLEERFLPSTIATVALFSPLFLACLVLAFCFHDRRVKERVAALESQLAGMRDSAARDPEGGAQLMGMNNATSEAAEHLTTIPLDSPVDSPKAILRGLAAPAGTEMEAADEEEERSAVGISPMHNWRGVEMERRTSSFIGEIEKRYSKAE